MRRRGSGEEVSIVDILEMYQKKLRNSYLSARRAIEEHIKYGLPIDNFFNALDDLESTFDRIILSVTLPSQGAPSRHLDIVLKPQEECQKKLVELRKMVEERRYNDALHMLDEIYETMRLALRVTLLVYAGWKTTLLRATYPSVVEYIPAEEIPVTDPLARRIYDVLVERGMMRADEIAEVFSEYSTDRINRALEELEARGAIRIRLRNGQTYFVPVR